MTGEPASDALILDALRTPIGRYGGVLAGVRPDDLAAHVMAAAVERNGIDGAQLEDVFFGDANQAGEDNRNVARMGALLAGLPVEVPGVTVNRLCASGLEAVNQASRAIRAGDADLLLAGGVESMTRAPVVQLKPERGFPRGVPESADTTIGWRFVNPRMAERYSTEGMGETAENVAERYEVTRADQDAFAVESHRRAAAAQDAGTFAREIVPIEAPSHERAPRRDRPRRGGSGRAARHHAGEARLAEAGLPRGRLGDRRQRVTDQRRRGLPRGRLRAGGRAAGQGAAGARGGDRGRGRRPGLHGRGPDPREPKGARPRRSDDRRHRPGRDQRGVRRAGPALHARAGDPGEKLNVNGGAIAIGHPLGCSGARMVGSLAWELRERGLRYGLATLCIGVGQGLATIIEAA